MLRTGSPATLVMVRVILNLHVTNWEFMSENGEHASDLRKPEVAAEHPPDEVRFNNPPHGDVGELFLCPRSMARHGDTAYLRVSCE